METNYGKPLNGRILVKRMEEVKATVGGIIIPDNAREKKQEGIVLAVGENRITDFGIEIKSRVSVGDRIMFGKYAGVDVTIDGNDFMLLLENDVIMILPEKPEESRIITSNNNLIMGKDFF